MDETSNISPIRRWLESMLVWYILLVIAYLLARFVFHSDWRLVAFLDNFLPYMFFPVVIGFLIAVLLRARRLSGIYLLTSLIGLLLVGRHLLPAQLSQPATTGTEIEIISFNLFPDNTRLEEAADWIAGHDPHILALQEIPADMSDFASLEAAYEYRASLDFVTDSVVYSRFPIIEDGQVSLDDWIIQRLVLDIEGTEVVLYNLHLFMPLNERELDWIALRYDDARRNAQIRQLVEQVSEETLPVIVAGDFNMTEWSPIYAELAAVLQDAYRRSSWGIGATFPAGASEKLNAAYPRLFRLDYIWYSEAIEAVSAIVGQNLGSDHLPLRVELIIP